MADLHGALSMALALLVLALRAGIGQLHADRDPPSRALGGIDPQRPHPEPMR